MWIKCLAEGQKVPGIDRNRTRNPLIQSQGFNPIYHGTSTFYIIFYGGNQVLTGGLKETKSSRQVSLILKFKRFE